MGVTHLDETLGETSGFEALLDTLSDEGSLRRRLEDDRVSGEKLQRDGISAGKTSGDGRERTAGMRALTWIM